MRFSVFALVFLWLSASVAYAGVLFVPHPGYDAPYYFSGTNARVFYNATIQLPDVHIEAAQLLLNGEVVVSETYPIMWTPRGPVHKLYSEHALMFDSSHFHPYASVEVKYKIKAGGVWHEHTYSAPNENSVYAWNHQEFDVISGGNGAGTVATLLDSVNYHTTETHGAWTAQSFENDIRGSIIYVNSHGGPEFHTSGSTTPQESIDAKPIGDYNYHNGRSLNNGTGLPPINSTGLPPVNLLLLEVCEAGREMGTTDVFISALMPYGNIYAPASLENQAVHAYTVYTRAADSEVAAETLVGQLANGKSILQASTYLLANAESLDILCSETEFGENRPLSLTTDRNIGGDVATRIKNVYTGFTGDSSNWFHLL